jgi:hypothetical protein
MGEPVDLTTNPIFIAKELYYYPDFQGYKVAIGKEQAGTGCSYYTNVVIIESSINESDIKKLRDDLAIEVGKLGSQGK